MKKPLIIAIILLLAFSISIFFISKTSDIDNNPQINIDNNPQIKINNNSEYNTDIKDNVNIDTNTLTITDEEMTEDLKRLIEDLSIQ